MWQVREYILKGIILFRVSIYFYVNVGRMHGLCQTRVSENQNQVVCLFFKSEAKSIKHGFRPGST